jgi:hypothetical protein
MKSQRQPVSRVAGFLFISCLLGTVISAQSLPPSRVLDLSAADGTKLKATYFGAGKPGPGVLLLHQCNRQRKVWNAFAQQLAAGVLTSSRWTAADSVRAVAIDSISCLKKRPHRSSGRSGQGTLMRRFDF